MVKETFEFTLDIFNIQGVTVGENIEAQFASDLTDEHLVSGIQPGEAVEVEAHGEELDDGDLEPHTAREAFTAPSEIGEYEVIAHSMWDSTSARGIFSVIRPEDGIIQPTKTRFGDWNLPTSLFTDLQFAFRPLSEVPKDARRQLGIPLEPLDEIEIGTDVKVDNILFTEGDDLHTAECIVKSNKTQAPIDTTVKITVDIGNNGALELDEDRTVRVFESATKTIAIDIQRPSETKESNICCDVIKTEWVI